MREKDLLWCFLIVMLFASTSLVGTGMGENPTRIYVSPNEIEGVNPCCDPFDIDIWIENVEDLYAYGFTLEFYPFLKVLVPAEISEGPFIKQGGTTFFTYFVDSFLGLITVSCFLLPPANEGVSGSGILATIKFRVLEAGESVLKLADTILLNSQYYSIAHDIDHSCYKGPRVEFVGLDYKNELMVSEKQTFNATVKKRGEACIHEPGEPPLWTQVRFDIVRQEDGMGITLRTDTYHIEEGRDYTFPPFEWYPEVGTYHGTALVEFRYYEDGRFNVGYRLISFNFIVHEN